MNQLAANVTIQAISYHDKFICRDYPVDCLCNVRNRQESAKPESHTAGHCHSFPSDIIYNIWLPKLIYAFLYLEL